MILFESERSGQSSYLYHQEDENLNFQMHAHESFEVIFVFSGELFCRVGDESFWLHKDEGLFILPGQIHSYKTEKTSKSYLCVFSADYVSAFYQTVKGKKLSNPVFTYSGGETDLLKDEKTNEFLKRSVLYGICGRIFSGSTLLRAQEHNFPLESAIAFYIQENFTKAISLRQIAAEFGYNYSYLSSFFNENFKADYSTYVNRFRAQYAAHLLKTTDKNVTELAMACGFSTIRNFNRVFRLEYSLSPREYRGFDTSTYSAK